ncbi:MAG: Asp-tRNA(Asn)/Glu-tRNA(Gln) amidotransferase subunit GatB [Tissierellia bacterium]|nr:Asp-tRNA(Asn)/Glu-tRNA(Gln) amidotransferase subunit GatB [Tissierellia bacterium]
MELRTIIGLEIHVELATKTKMFCPCKNEFGQAPNTNICPICLGHPGALPNMNNKAIEYAVMAGLAFECEIRDRFKMDRKKYFYPDLVKGYQITQEDMPLCEHGKITIESKNGPKDIRIRRIHIEEDTGKSIHNEEGNTLMDYNRSGVPLIEIVSEPDMNTPEEARAFLDMLRERIKFLGISDVKMAEGSLRCDVNINVKTDDGFKTEISEIKNLNSFKSVSKALEYEQQRHEKLAKDRNPGEKETRRWSEEEMATIPMRHKEEGNDYRFSVEGDIPFTQLPEKFIENIKHQLPELPHDKMERFIDDYQLDDYDADILTRNKALADFFEDVTNKVKDPAMVSNWILTDVMRRVNEHEMEFEEINITAKDLATLLEYVKEGKINQNTGKKVLRKMFEEDVDPKTYIEKEGLLQMSDTSELEEVVDQVLAENPESIEAIKGGKDRAIGFLVGQCMKATRGKGNPQMFNEMIREKIKEM